MTVSAQVNPTWGLDRIDQLDLPLDNSYDPSSTGSGVVVYIVDTGIRATHSDYSSRVASGYDAVDNDNNPEDCHGHGTHVAGTAVGTTYGVAKDAIVQDQAPLQVSSPDWIGFEPTTIQTIRGSQPLPT